MESVRLFLAHPQCSKEIVRIKDNRGSTAEMVMVSPLLIKQLGDLKYSLTTQCCLKTVL